MATSAVSNLPEYVQCGSLVSNPWYLIKSKPCQEDRAEQNLSQIGADVFLPQYAPVRSKPLQRKPFFPGYLFASFPLSLYRAASNAFGVSKIVRFGAEPATVTDAFIYDLEMRLMRDLPIEDERKSRFHAGDKVQVIDGPMRGFYAVFESSISDGERVRILLDTVSRMPVEVGRNDLMLL